MAEKEIQEVLDELNTVRPEKLNESGKRLYEAIMKIADERDRLNNIINEIYTFLSQYTITHTWQKVVIEDTIRYIDELKGNDSNE